MPRFLTGIIAIIALNACTPSTQLVGDGNSNNNPNSNEELLRLGEDAEIRVERDSDWCEGEEWELWVENSTYGRNNGYRWDDDPLEEDDSDVLEGTIGIWGGDILFINGGCSDDDDTWLVEDSDSSTRITVNVEMIEIDGEEYSISDRRDDETAAPDYGECVKRPHNTDLVCRVLDEDSDDNDDEDEWCDDDDGDGYGDPDQCAMYEDGEEPRGYVDNDDDCDDQDEDEHDECQSDDEVEYCYDSDGDGFGDEDRCDDYEIGEQPSSRWVRNDDDCDDDDPDVNPDEDEIDNNVDDDCDGDEDDDDSSCEDCDESSTDEIEVIVTKSDDWCEGEKWSVWMAENEHYEDEETFDLEVNDPDDEDEVEGNVDLVDGDYYRLQAWCDHDGDNNIWDANTWGLENTGAGVTEHFDRIEIDGTAYTISTSEDSTPSAGHCNRYPGEYHFICKIDL